MKGLWGNSDFVKLWSAQTTSALGSQIALLAYPLTAVLLLNASTFQMGILRALGSASSFAVGIFAGVIADKWNRKVLLITSDVGRAILAFLIASTALLGYLRIELLYLITFASGALSVIGDVSGMALVPSVVEKGDLVEANSKAATSDSAATMVGPGISGLLIQALSVPAAIVIDGLSFVFSAIIISRVRTPERIVLTEEPRRGVLHKIWEGITFVYGHPLLGPMAQAVALQFLSMSIVWTIFILYAVRELDLGSFWLGIIYSFLGAGLLGGSLAARPLSDRFGKGRMMILGSLLQVIALGLIPAASGAFVFEFLLFAHVLLAFGIQLNGINLMSIRQSETPNHLQGRMSASFRFVNLGMAMIGAVIAGWLGEAIGLRAGLIIAAIGMVLPFLRLAFSPVRNIANESFE